MMEKKKMGSGGNNQQQQQPKKPTAKKTADPRTLFVKFHPPSASITRQHLSDHFSNYGPVNRCSVIRQSKSKQQQQKQTADDNDDDQQQPNLDRGSKGYGFVRFVHEDDAKSAADATKNRSSSSSKGGKKSSSGEVMIVDGVQYRIHAERAVDATTAAAASPAQKKKKKKEASSKPDTTQQATTATADDDDNVGTTTTTTKTTKHDNKDDDADTKYQAETKRKRTSRVIIRNLSFYANEKHIKIAMETNFGPVSAVDLPLVPDLPTTNNEDGKKNNKNQQQHPKKNKNAVPRHRGFAFVTFTNANAAKQAVEKGSEIMIKNRMVAIDFSVSKMEHQKMMKDEKEKKKRGKGEEDVTESESDSSGSGSDSENEEEKDSKDGSDGEDDDSSDSDSDEDSDSESDDSEDEDENEEETKEDAKEENDTADAAKETPEYDETEAKRTLFLRNLPFDAKRHDVFELFRKFGRIEAVYLVKDRQSGVFKGTAFVRFENVKGCAAAMEASGGGEQQNEGEAAAQQFVSSKNMAMGLGQEGGNNNNTSGGLSLNGRHLLVDLAVDRTTASSLAVQRDDEGKPIKKMVGKDRRNLYLKNEGRVSSAADSSAALDASATHGGVWEDLPPSDRAKRERAFADKSTKLRSPLFFISPTRLSIRNLAKHINESELKKLVFGALKTGLELKLVGPKDAVSHWRAGGELPHSEIMRRATDPVLVIPPLDEKNMKESIPSVFIERDVSGGKKASSTGGDAAPSRGFGFVEFTHHMHALAALRQLNNNPLYSAEFAAGGKHASEMAKQKRGKKSNKNKAKVDPETGAEFLSEDGKVCVPRLLVEFGVENKVKARQQAEKIAQKKANKIKQRIENKEKNKEKKQQPTDTTNKKEKKKGRGALQREKKRARKEAGEDDGDNLQNKDGKDSSIKKPKLDESADKPKEKKPKMLKPQKKRKIMDKDEDALEDMIKSYKSSFSKGAAAGGKPLTGESNASSEPQKKHTREKVAKKRWFE